MNAFYHITKIAISYIVLMLLVTTTFAQTNSPEIHKVLVKNTTDITYVNSFGAISIEDYPEQDSDLEWHTTSTDNQYEIIYQPTSGFTGFDQVQVQYRVQGSNNQYPVKYLTIYYEVVNSLVTAGDDFVIGSMGNILLMGNILDNDATSDSGLEIVEIVSSSNGVAEIYNTNDGIKFTPTDGFTGMAYVTYVVEDDAGTTDKAVVSINITSDDILASETIDITTTNDKDLVLHLPSSNFEITSSTDEYGSASVFNGFMTFVPNENAIGVEVIVLTDDSGNERTYNINVIELNNDFGFVRNDKFFTASNTSVSFNVLENDIKDNFPIVDFSNELIQGSTSGEFSYTPEQDFVGVKEFNYTVWNGFENEEGIIFITIADFNPKQLAQYNFNSIANNPVFLKYDIPITSNYFQIVAAPSHGNVEYLENVEGLDVGCETIDAERSVIYYPNTDFVGHDEFEIEYCITGQSDCQLIKVAVDIVAEDGSCHCVDNCVWPGDANNDGMVRVDDLLAIAYNVGETGAERNDADYSQWYGQTSQDWNQTIHNEKLNVKYSDTDGDGFVALSDTSELANNYTSYHSLLKEDVLAITDYPFILTPQSTVLDSGDVLIIDIAIGDENAQVLDLHGLAFTLNFDSDFVDSSSLKVNFFEDSWFSMNSPTVQMSKVPKDGIVEAGFAKIGRGGVHGFGKIAESECIIEEELDDTRLSSGRVPMTIRLSNATALDAEGNKVILPDAVVKVYIDLSNNQDDPSLEDKLICYPNPAAESINIHFNGGNIMEEITVYDVQGRQVDFIPNLNTEHQTLNLNGFDNGLYVVKVKSSKGLVTKKINVFK